MPRRMIDPKIWVNLKVGSLPDAGRLLFIGIFSTADDDGRLEADPRFLKATVFPYDEDKTVEMVGKLRDDCTRLGLIRVYSKNGREYLDIPGWREHQMIRKDRYNPSKHPSFDEADNQMTPIGQPDDTHQTTTGNHSIVKSSIVKSNTPLLRKGAHTKKVDPVVNEIFTEMRKFLRNSEACVAGSLYPTEKSKKEESLTPAKNKAIDPVPNYGKEGTAIKRMLTRGFTREEILACWRSKVSQCGGEFVSMTWVNEDIGKKGKPYGRHPLGKVPTEEELDAQEKAKGLR